IKKIKMIRDRYGMSVSAESQVNQLLSRGWVLLVIETKEASPNQKDAVFTLGHSDPSADDKIDVNEIYKESLENL
ncbi:MAG TPA: hypothetical protein VMW86_03860, partial [Dehalococcoidales bacterium]|nr:hypothetical protein [Dehalococcoidales bacterium]